MSSKNKKIHQIHIFFQQQSLQYTQNFRNTRKYTQLYSSKNNRRAYDTPMSRSQNSQSIFSCYSGCPLHLSRHPCPQSPQQTRSRKNKNSPRNRQKNKQWIHQTKPLHAPQHPRTLLKIPLHRKKTKMRKL